MSESTESDKNRRIVQGWEGRYYEDYTVGDIYKHPFGRTLTEEDVVGFCDMTLVYTCSHYNEVHMEDESPYEGKRLANGLHIVALAMGMGSINVGMTATAMLGYDNVRFHEPSYIGDTIWSETEVLSKREMESDETLGIVTAETRAYNQRDELVCSFEQATAERKREYAPWTKERPVGWREGVGTQESDLE